MKISTITLIIFFLVFTTSTYTSPQKQKSPKNSNCTDGFGQREKVEFYRLVLQWPGYKYNSDKPPPNLNPKPMTDLTIHGLWPTVYRSPFPKRCTTGAAKFEYGLIRDMETDLYKNWPNLRQNNAKRFWRYEWEVHGTCSKWYNNPHKYFQKTLELKMKFDLFSVLQSRGITPSLNSYVTDEIIDIIKKEVGNLLNIYCVKTRNYEEQLWEIHVCLDKTNLNTMDCPYSNNTCGNMMKYLPF